MIDPRIRSLLKGLQIGCYIEIIKRNRGGTYSGTLVSFDEYFLTIETISDAQKRIPTNEIHTWNKPKQERADQPVIAEALHNGYNGHQGENARREIDQLFAAAKDFLSKNDHSNAINRIKCVLKIDSEYPGAQAFLERCREAQRQRQTQGGSRETNYFGQAQSATSHEEAIKYLYLAIDHGQKVHSAVKDLAHRLAKIGEGGKAIEVLEKHRQSITDQQSVDNVLIQIYIQFKQYADALKLLEKKMALPTTKRGTEILRQIADCHIGLGNYSQAKPYLQEVIQLTTENKAAQKRLALCYIKEQQYHDAEQILAEVLKISPDDAQARELLEDATHRRTSETTIDLSDTSHEVSKFARFFLDRCEYRGVPSARRQGANLRNLISRISRSRLKGSALQESTMNPLNIIFRLRALFLPTKSWVIRLLYQDSYCVVSYHEETH